MTLSATLALIGKCSLMTMPSTLVGMTPKVPRYFSSALGFGSQVSIWLTPPAHQIRITERSFAFVAQCA